MSLSYLKYILSLVFAFAFFSISVPAQNLPQLPMDSRIKKGTLSSGVTYYMVTDASEKGYAQIAIVQRDSKLSQIKRNRLESEFFGRMAIAPGSDGFIYEQDNSTIYRFRRIPFYRPEVLDSTLLYSFEQIAVTKTPQAIIVSGDIDAVELKKKMDVFSLLVPKQEKDRPAITKEWVSNPAPTITICPDGKAEVFVTYRSARIPAANMNTAQSIVTELFVKELLVIAKHRLEKNLAESGIPHAPISTKAVYSADYGGDELYGIGVRVAPEDIAKTMDVLAWTLGELEENGAGVTEFSESKQVLLPEVRRRAHIPPSTEDYVSRCISNYLYGASLAPDSETMRLFAKKNVADIVEASLFNSFSGALLTDLENLDLHLGGVKDSLDENSALFNYNLNWLLGSYNIKNKDYAWHGADSSAFEVSCPKVKIKNEKTEPVTGGTMWTFSNELRVVFKPVKGCGIFNYALELNGGLNQIGNLREGEGAYIGEMLKLHDIASVPADEVQDILCANGVSLECTVDINSMAIKGDGPADKLELVLKTLLGYSVGRNFNNDAFERYRKNEALRESSVEDELYFRMQPGFKYTGRKKAGVLSVETPKKASRYFSDRFSRVNDGVLIISGDLEADAVKKLLNRYLGGFNTAKGGAGRKSVEFKAFSGATTANGTIGEKGVYLLMDAEYAVTGENVYNAKVGVEALRRTLASHLAGYGFTSEVSLNLMVQPQERAQIFISCKPIPADKLPVDICDADVERALSAVRLAIKDAAGKPQEAVDINAWKALMAENTKSSLATPSGFAGALLDRYSSNKDLTSRYTEYINAVNPATVQEFISTMANGGRIEYLVQ